MIIAIPCMTRALTSNLPTLASISNIPRIVIRYVVFLGVLVRYITQTYAKHFLLAYNLIEGVRYNSLELFYGIYSLCALTRCSFFCSCQFAYHHFF